MVSKESHVRCLQIKKRGRQGRKLEKVATIAVLTESKKRARSQKIRQNVTMLAKFEVSCLVGTHTL